MQTEQLLCWSGMTDTEHSKTSSSNEEELSGFWVCLGLQIKSVFGFNLNYSARLQFWSSTSFCQPTGKFNNRMLLEFLGSSIMV